MSEAAVEIDGMTGRWDAPTDVVGLLARSGVAELPDRVLLDLDVDVVLDARE